MEGRPPTAPVSHYFSLCSVSQVSFLATCLSVTNLTQTLAVVPRTIEGLCLSGSVVSSLPPVSASGCFLCFSQTQVPGDEFASHPTPARSSLRLGTVAETLFCRPSFKEETPLSISRSLCLPDFPPETPYLRPLSGQEGGHPTASQSTMAGYQKQLPSGCGGAGWHVSRSGARLFFQGSVDLTPVGFVFQPGTDDG